MGEYAPDGYSEPHTVYVTFGPKEHQVLTVEVASMVLTSWRDDHPEQFGMYLAEALVGVRPKAGRARS